MTACVQQTKCVAAWITAARRDCRRGRPFSIFYRSTHDSRTPGASIAATARLSGVGTCADPRRTRHGSASPSRWPPPRQQSMARKDYPSPPRMNTLLRHRRRPDIGGVARSASRHGPREQCLSPSLPSVGVPAFTTLDGEAVLPGASSHPEVCKFDRATNAPLAVRCVCRSRRLNDVLTARFVIEIACKCSLNH